MMLAQGGVSLPAGYTKIEYLESDGTQFIDTGFKPNQDTRVICDYLVDTKPNTSRAVYGCTDGSKYYGVFLAASDFTNVWYNTANKYDKSVAGRWLIDQNKNVATINGDTLTWSAATFQFEYSLFLFACNGPNVTYVGASRIYSFKIYDNDVLVRDFIPCTNPDGISGLWDSVNDVFYKMLPADYTRLDFIETDGATYIDTEYKPNNNTRVIFEGYNNNANSKWLFGTWNASGSGQFGMSMQTGAGVRYGKQTAAITSQTVGEVYAELNTTAYNFNGTTGTLNAETFTCSYNLFIGALNMAGTPTDSSYGFIGRIYSVKIYDNGTLVRDFIPSMNASGEAGLYDLKNDVWYALKPVVKPKEENKISLKILRRKSPVTLPDGSTSSITFYVAIPVSSTNVASDITVDIAWEFSDGSSQSDTLTLSKHGYYEEKILGPQPSNVWITSISPTEDDTYIYTF